MAQAVQSQPKLRCTWRKDPRSLAEIGCEACRSTGPPQRFDSDRGVRVFLGLTGFSGYYRELKAGFRELGVKCTFIDLMGNPRDYRGRDEGSMAPVIRRVRDASEHAGAEILRDQLQQPKRLTLSAQ